MSHAFSIEAPGVPKDTWKSESVGQTRILQIICAAMIVGSLIFAGIALTMVLVGSFPTSETAPTLTYVGAGFAFLSILFRSVVPELFAACGRRAVADGTWDECQKPASRNNPRNVRLIERTGDAGRLMVVYTGRTIIAMAMLEGGCLMNLVVYMIEQQAISLGVAGGLLVGLAIAFPLHDRSVTWIEQQLRALGK